MSSHFAIHSLHKTEFNDDLFNVFLKILKSEHMNFPRKISFI